MHCSGYWIRTNSWGQTATKGSQKAFSTHYYAIGHHSDDVCFLTLCKAMNIKYKCQFTAMNVHLADYHVYGYSHLYASNSCKSGISSKKMWLKNRCLCLKNNPITIFWPCVYNFILTSKSPRDIHADHLGMSFPDHPSSLLNGMFNRGFGLYLCMVHHTVYMYTLNSMHKQLHTCCCTQYSWYCLFFASLNACLHVTSFLVSSTDYCPPSWLIPMNSHGVGIAHACPTMPCIHLVITMVILPCLFGAFKHILE